MSKLSRQDARDVLQALLRAQQCRPRRGRRRHARRRCRPLAQATYGRNKAAPAVAPRTRPQEPEADRRRAGCTSRMRAPATASYCATITCRAIPRRARRGREPRAAGAHPRRRRHLAPLPAAGGGEAGIDRRRELLRAAGLDSGRLAFVVIPFDGVALEKVEAELDAIIAEVAREGRHARGAGPRQVDARGARACSSSDNQVTLARRYGEGVALGRSIADLDAPAEPHAGESLGRHQAGGDRSSCALQRSVTGTLAPPAAAEDPASRQWRPSNDRKGARMRGAIAASARVAGPLGYSSSGLAFGLLACFGPAWR